MTVRRIGLGCVAVLTAAVLAACSSGAHYPKKYDKPAATYTDDQLGACLRQHNVNGTVVRDERGHWKSGLVGVTTGGKLVRSDALFLSGEGDKLYFGARSKVVICGGQMAYSKGGVVKDQIALGITQSRGWRLLPPETKGMLVSISVPAFDPDA
jgi:hypothetical protein